MFRSLVLCAFALVICHAVQAQSWELPPDAQKIVEKAKLGKPLTPKEMARLQQALEAAQKKALQNAAKGTTPSTPKQPPGAKDSDPRLKCTVIVDYNLKLEKPQEGQTCDGNGAEKWTQITQINGGFSAKGQLRRFQPGGLQGDEMILIGLDGGAKGSGTTTITGGGLHKADTSGTSWTMGKLQGVLTLRAFPSRGDRMTGEFGFLPTINGRAWVKDGCTEEETKSAFDVPEPLGAVGNFLPSYAKEQFDAKSNIDYVQQAQAMSKKFGFAVPPLSAGQKAQMAQMAQGWKKWNDERLCDWGISRDAFRKGFVSGQPFRVTGSGSGSKKLQDGTQISGRLSLTVVVGEVPPLELVVRPQHYETWMPAGGSNEKTAGNTLGIGAHLLTKDGKAPPALVKAQQFKFELLDVSDEPGVCLNQPLQNATRDPDLKFESAKNPGVDVTDKTVITRAPDITATAVISCFDWGAFGKLKVTAELEDGQQLVGYLAGQKGVTEILVPKRAKDSKVADAWKKLRQIKTQSDQDDSEKQAGNQNDGDGLTLYEEYRGLIARGTHVSLNPNKKEIVVANPSGAAAQGALALFQKASSGIEVVEVKDDELPQSRQVNLNYGTANGGAQHGLRLVEAGLATGTSITTYGRAIHVNDPSGATQPAMKSPVECLELRLNAQYMAALIDPTVTAASRKNIQDTMEPTIAHELAHGVGVQHHGKNQAYLKHTIQSYHTSTQVFDEKGQPITTRPLDIEKNSVGFPQGDASGDVNCLMCYNALYSWRLDTPTSSIFYKVASLPPGNTFCSSPRGTGRNANGQCFGDADAAANMGNCLKQFKVRDW